jgi:Flp pilus assembly protein CpaB
MVATAETSQEVTDPVVAAPVRRIERRRGVPGGRALAGGFLIAVAAVGVFAAHSRATALPVRTFVVAAHALEPGATLTAADLAVVEVSVGDGATLADQGLFTDRAPLVGARTVGPIGAGEFIQASSVVRRRGGADAHEVSLAIEPARAVGGKLRPGERVHVVATFGAGGDAYSAVVVRAARVIAIDGGGGGLADTRTLTITLAVATGDDALAVAHAVDAGKLTLVRAGAVEPGGPYRPSTTTGP